MTDLSKLDIPFIPVSVTKGRKFRGKCYLTENWTASNGYAGSGMRPLRHYQVNKGVDAITLNPVYFNGVADEWKVDPNDLALAKTMYVRNVLEACVKRCGKDEKWRANYLRKVLGCFCEDAKKLAAEAEQHFIKNEDEGNRAERLEAELEIREGIASANS